MYKTVQFPVLCGCETVCHMKGGEECSLRGAEEEGRHT